jgi:hypothetical protein
MPSGSRGSALESGLLHRFARHNPLLCIKHLRFRAGHHGARTDQGASGCETRTGRQGKALDGASHLTHRPRNLDRLRGPFLSMAYASPPIRQAELAVVTRPGLAGPAARLAKEHSRTSGSDYELVRLRPFFLSRCGEGRLRRSAASTPSARTRFSIRSMLASVDASFKRADVDPVEFCPMCQFFL